jgi:hypothetical protein
VDIWSEVVVGEINALVNYGYIDACSFGYCPSIGSIDAVF